MSSTEALQVFTDDNGMPDTPCREMGIFSSKQTYRIKHAVRIILYHENLVLLVRITNGPHRYAIPARWELPGKDLSPDSGESHVQIVTRMARFYVDVDKECVAISEEFWGDVHRITFGYSAKPFRKKETVEFTDICREESIFEPHEWVDKHEALKKLREMEPNTPESKMAQKRDVFMMEQYCLL